MKLFLILIFSLINYGIQIHEGLLNIVDDKKAHIPFEKLVHLSELIVIGSISEVAETSYNFRIKESIKGDSLNIIKVQKFQEWFCDTRIEKHQIGQNIILFLEKNIQEEWQIINGSTGELIIIDDKINVHRHSIVRVNYEFDFVTPSEVIEATHVLLDCYRLNAKNKYEQKCEQKNIDSKLLKNSFLEDAISRMENFKRIIKLK